MANNNAVREIKPVDINLSDYATERQKEILAAIESEGSQRAAAKKLGINKSTISSAVQAVQFKAATMGYSPKHNLVHPVPDGFKLKGASTLYDMTTGEAKVQWIKSTADSERQAEIMRHTVDAMSEEIKPEKPVLPPKYTLENLLNVYVITDFHLGSKCWGEETGASWDIDIAEDTLVKWFGSAIALSPDAKIGVFSQLGDFAHFDGILAITPTSGNILDADTRFQKLVRVLIRVIRKVTSMLLAKHEHVHLLMAEGNHDLASSAWMRELFASLYIDEPRITVDTRPDPYYCIEHGNTSLFFHHGHKKRIDGLETVFIAKFREVFGRTKFSYAHVGHLHHDVLKETNTMKVEQHRTLSAPDSHASRGGWLSGRDAKVITYSSEFGEVCRNTVSIDMLNAI